MIWYDISYHNEICFWSCDIAFDLCWPARIEQLAFLVVFLWIEIVLYLLIGLCITKNIILWMELFWSFTYQGDFYYTLDTWFLFCVNLKDIHRHLDCLLNSLIMECSIDTELYCLYSVFVLYNYLQRIYKEFLLLVVCMDSLLWTSILRMF